MKRKTLETDVDTHTRLDPCSQGLYQFGNPLLLQVDLYTEFDIGYCK